MKIVEQPSIIKTDVFKDYRQTIFSGLEEWEITKTKGFTNDGHKDLDFINFSSSQEINHIDSQSLLFEQARNKRSMSIEANQDDNDSCFAKEFQNYGLNVRPMKVHSVDLDYCLIFCAKIYCSQIIKT